MQYELHECKAKTLSQYTAKEKRCWPQRFWVFIETDLCNNFLERAIEFSRVCLRAHKAGVRGQRSSTPQPKGAHDGSTPPASTRNRGQRAIEREVDSALRLLSEIYTSLIRKYNGPLGHDRADCHFYEALYKLTDGILEQVHIIVGGASQADLMLAQHHVHRVFRGPNFNTKMHAKRPTTSWRDLPDRSKGMSMRSQQLLLPDCDRAPGLSRAMQQRSPLLSVKCPSKTDVIKTFASTTLSSRLCDGVGIPGVPHRCSPTMQKCIAGRCTTCSPPRILSRRSFYASKRQSLPQKVETAGVSVKMRAKLRGIDFDASKEDRDSVIDYIVAMLQDFGLFNILDVDTDKFTSFLIDVRALHSRLAYSNWAHSVNVCRTVYYLLSTGGASCKFSAEEIYLMFVSSLCSAIEFPGNDAVLVTSKQDLAKLYASGSQYDAHYHTLTARALCVAQASHCNLFESFPSAMMPMFNEVIDTCLKATQVLPASEFVQQLHALLPHEPPMPTPVPGRGKKTTRGLSGGAAGWTKASIASKASDRYSVKDFGLCGTTNSVGAKLFGAPALKKITSGKWYEQVDTELMNLIMTASWLFYPTMCPANAMTSAQRFTKEMYTEGDRIIADLPSDVDPGIVVPACQNRLSGNWEMGHRMFTELVVIPLYQVLTNRLGSDGNLDQVNRQVREFHYTLKTTIANRASAHARALERSESQRASKVENTVGGQQQEQTLPNIRPASRMGSVGVVCFDL